MILFNSANARGDDFVKFCRCPGRRSATAAVLAMAAFFFTLLPVRGATRCGDVTVSVESPLSTRVTHGYSEYRVMLRNEHPGEEKIVRIEIPAESYGYNRGGIERLSRSVRIPPATTVRVSLFQPPLQIAGDGMAVIVDRERHTLPLGYGGQVSRGAHTKTVLATKSLYELDDLLEKHSTGASSRGRPRYMPSGSSHAVARAESEVADWSTSWLSYSRYDGVVLKGTEWAAAPARVQNALIRFAENGGLLWILGGAPPEAPWKSHVLVQRPSLTVYGMGFGIYVVTQHSDLAKISDDDFNDLSHELEESQGPWRTSNWHIAQDLLGFGDKLAVPVGGMFLLIMLFGIIIGPVNMFVLAKYNRRIWLLWTVPALSLVTCAAIVAYSVLSEGFDVYAARHSITILDQTSRHAATIGYTGVYSPVTQSEGLHFPVTSEITPLVQDTRHASSGASSYAVDWTRDQHLHEGWITARVPTYLLVRSNVDRRERLQFTAADDQLVVVNGLGAPIRQLYAADSNGKIYTCADVQPGQSAELTASAFPNAQKNWQGRKAFAERIWERVFVQDQKLTARDPKSLLQPGTYVAVLDGNPFIARATEEAIYQVDNSLVLGLGAPGL